MSQDNSEEAAEPALVLLSKAQVLKKVPVTEPTLWAWVRAGKFPKPRDISPNKTVW
jgi:predicted DNA-binding transcriptional regulator AlpA